MYRITSSLFFSSRRRHTMCSRDWSSDVCSADLLCTLMLRGPQTVGELRDRSERMRAFSDLEEVEACLETLMHWEPRPLATRLPRQPGMKEPRYMHLLSGDAGPSAQRIT